MRLHSAIRTIRWRRGIGLRMGIKMTAVFSTFKGCFRLAGLLLAAAIVAFSASSAVFASTVPQLDIDAINGGWVNWVPNSGCSNLTNGAGGPLLGAQYPQGVDANRLAQNIDDYIKSVHPNSPLVGLGVNIAQGGQKYNVNPALLVGVSQQESGLGLTGSGPPPKHNIWGDLNNHHQPVSF